MKYYIEKERLRRSLAGITRLWQVEIERIANLKRMGEEKVEVEERGEYQRQEVEGRGEFQRQ